MIYAILPAVALAFAAPVRAAALPDVQRALDEDDLPTVIAAMPGLERKAAAGDAPAQSQLGQVYLRGVAGLRDTRKANEHFRRAAAQGDPVAMTLLAFDVAYGYGTGGAVDRAAGQALYDKARAIYARRAPTGDLAAMIWMAQDLQNGPWNGKVDKAAAAAWFEKAKERYLPAARRGDARAQYAIGDLMMGNWQWNDARPVAKEWLTKAADQGYVPAMALLGQYYADPRADGITPDYERAQQLWEKAYAAGSGQAAQKLAFHFLYGHAKTVNGPGMSADVPKGQDWLLKADALGFRWAGCQAASRMVSGEGVPQDADSALKLLRPRAAAGFNDCLKTLGDMAAKGEGLPKNDVQALKFYLLDELDGSQWVTALVKDMSARDVSAARQLAAEFRWTPMDPPEAATLKGSPSLRSGEAVAAAPATAAPAPAAAARETAPAPLPEHPDDYALVVGIEHYRGLPAADYAEADAASMRDRLVALGFPDQNVISLTGDQATRSSLQAYLEEWLPKNVNEKSRVFFYFSGHGSPEPRTGQAFLVPYDGNPEFLKSTAYPLKDVYAALAKLPAKQVLVALDSCFSGAGGRSVLPKGARPLVTKTSLASPAGGKLIVFAAAAGDEISGGLDEQGHGAFTYYLLEGLSGAAADKGGAITAGGLERYLKPKVAIAAHRQNRDQTAQLLGDPAAVLFRLSRP